MKQNTPHTQIPSSLKEICRIEVPSRCVEGTIIEHAPTLRFKASSLDLSKGWGIIEWHSSVSGRVSKPTLSWELLWDENKNLTSMNGIGFDEWNRVKPHGDIHRLLTKAGIQIPQPILDRGAMQPEFSDNELAETLSQ